MFLLLNCRDDIIAVCLTSAFHATKAALPHMLEKKWGRIINTGALASQEVSCGTAPGCMHAGCCLITLCCP